LRAFLPAEASVSNPVDMIASATADDYGKALEIVAADPNVDALVVIFTPPLVTRAEDVARAIVDAAKSATFSKPVITVFLSARGVPDELKSRDIRIPSFAFPEAAATALARVARYGEWRARPRSEPPRFSDLRRDEAAALVATALARGDEWLSLEETSTLLSCYGLSLVAQRIVATPRDAGEAAGQIGGEVALKAIAPGLLHKTDSGGVRLHLTGATQVSVAAEEMATKLAETGQPVSGFIVQPMISGRGVEMLVGIAHDPQFGPVVACGAGGVLVELMRDVAVRLTPLTRDDASEMIRSLKSYQLLTGFRGSPLCDIAALEESLLRVSAMVEDLPQIIELDCNPIVVRERGAIILDARARVSAREAPSLLGARR
jgi:acyl-CoA synthetase (NDP forming)